jgi:hypothetical protein
MTIRCTKFRAFQKNTLKGFADLESQPRRPNPA